jgi:uncharacterized protein (DUF1330 family)
LSRYVLTKRRIVIINILVTLEVKNFDSLTIFETIASEIMHFHGGRIVRAFETIRNTDNSGQEVHLLEFPSDAAFAEYRVDSRLSEHTKLRNLAIISTEIVISSTLKSYTQPAS